MSEQWAIKVQISENDWVYITEIAEGMDYNTPVIKVFSTKKEAKKHALIWGKNAKIIEYDITSS